MRRSIKVDEKADLLANELAGLYKETSGLEVTKMAAVSFAIKNEHSRLKEEIKRK